MDDKLVKIAAQALGMSEEAVVEHGKEVPEIDGWYFWSPTRGGKAVLVNKAGERLVAPSSISFKQHLAEFKKGRRN